MDVEGLPKTGSLHQIAERSESGRNKATWEPSRIKGSYLDRVRFKDKVEGDLPMQ